MSSHMVYFSHLGKIFTVISILFMKIAKHFLYSASPHPLAKLKEQKPLLQLQYQEVWCLLTQNDLWSSVMPCRYQSTMMFIIVCCTSKVNNFDICVFQCAFITFLERDSWVNMKINKDMKSFISTIQKACIIFLEFKHSPMRKAKKDMFFGII